MRRGSINTVSSGNTEVFKAHRLLHHSTLGLRVIKKKEEEMLKPLCSQCGAEDINTTLAIPNLYEPSATCAEATAGVPPSLRNVVP